MLRGARRAVGYSARIWISNELTTLGWFGPTCPYGAAPLQSVEAGPWGLGAQGPGAGTSEPRVSVEVIGAADDTQGEVGGPLIRSQWHLVVMVLALPGIADVLSDDIADMLAYRTSTGRIPLLDPSTGVEVTSEDLEVTTVSSGRARIDRTDWLLVQAEIFHWRNRSA